MKTQTEKKTKIRLVNLEKQYRGIKREIDEAIARVVDSQHFIMGPEISRFEESMAAYCGTKCAVGVSSGTSGLFLALKALGIKAGDEVITSPYTFIATAEVIANTGAKPVFADIDPKTYNIDPAKIEEKITGRTKAIIPVHLYGQCADMEAILGIARSHGLKVVEDAAQAIGARQNGKKAGSMGEAGCFSFFPSKNLGCFGDGGMVITNDKRLAARIRLLSLHGSSRTYEHSALGDNARLDSLQAAVLNVKLKYLDGWLEKRRKNAAFLTDAFRGIKRIIAPFTLPANLHTFHQYTLGTEKDLRDDLIKFLSGSGIESRVYYPIPLHMQECFRYLGRKPDDFPVSKKAASRTFVLPVCSELEQEELEYIRDKVREFFQ